MWLNHTAGFFLFALSILANTLCCCIADCDFVVQLLHEPAEPPPPKTEDDKKSKSPLRGASSKRGKDKGKNESVTTAALMAARAKTMFPAAFGLDRMRLRLKHGG